MLKVELHAGDHVRLDAWKHYSVPVNTLRAYARKYREDAEEAYRNALEKDGVTAWTTFTGNALYGDHVYAEKCANERRINFSNAIVLQDGQIVTIEGCEYTVKVMRGNEKSPQNSDPIHFVRI